MLFKKSSDDFDMHPGPILPGPSRVGKQDWFLIFLGSRIILVILLLPEEQFSISFRVGHCDKFFHYCLP